jgi:hypothetical protein
LFHNFWLNMFSVPTLAVISSKNFYVVMEPSEYVVWVLSRHSHTKMPVFSFLLSLKFPDKNKQPPASLVLQPPLWSLVIPLKLTYFVNSLIPFSVNPTYRNSWYSNVWILCLLLRLLRGILVRWSPQLLQRPATLCWEVVRLLPNPQAGHNCLFNIFTTTGTSRDCRFHPKPQNVLCHGDEGPTYPGAVSILAVINSQSCKTNKAVNTSAQVAWKTILRITLYIWTYPAQPI